MKSEIIDTSLVLGRTVIKNYFSKKGQYIFKLSVVQMV